MVDEVHNVTNGREVNLGEEEGHQGPEGDQRAQAQGDAWEGEHEPPLHLRRLLLSGREHVRRPVGVYDICRRRFLF